MTQTGRNQHHASLDCRYRHGSIFVMTLWIVIVLVGLVLILGQSMRVEVLASANQIGAMQATAIERGAEQYVLSLIDQDKEQVLTLGDEYFTAIPVGEGYFWIIRPNYVDAQMSSYGLVDEASKLNLNSATVDMLSMLPDMPTDLPPAIKDWRDSDSTIGDGGAENEYYLSLPNPYSCKNEPLESVEELLLIKEATPHLLYGQTASGMANRASPWSEQTDPVLSLGTTATQTRGLVNYLTVYSTERNTDSSGRQKINVNDSNPQALISLLQNAFGASRADAIRRLSDPRPPFTDIFAYYLRTGMTQQEFQQIADRLATSTQRTSTGRINVNTAPREVLMCLPGLEDAEVSALISGRSGANVDRTSIAWVAGALGPKAVGLGNLITGRPSRYSADIVAVNGNGRAFKRCRIVVDGGASPPKIIYRKDLTDAGWPMAPEIRTSLRTGTALTAARPQTGSFAQ